MMEICVILYLLFTVEIKTVRSASGARLTNLKILTYHINEESEVGTFVGNLKLDAERNLLIPSKHLNQFELYDDTKQGFFRVDLDSGKLFVASRIDRETICPLPETTSDKLITEVSDLRVTASNSHDREKRNFKQCEIHLALLVSQEYWVNVVIFVHDVNDHQPFFPVTQNTTHISPYVVNVSEGAPVGYEVPLLRAKDADDGVNGVQMYSLRGPELDPLLFTISYQPPFILNLIILGELDAEVKSTYTGELVACDGGQPIPKCVNQLFKIQVTDLNDNKPIFDQTVYELEVDETVAVRTTLMKLSASDADSGPRGRVHYRFGESVSSVVVTHFGLDKGTGELYTKKSLDAKENARFFIPVVAEDGAAVPLIGQAVVQVTVKDINNHAPWIEAHAGQSKSEQAKLGDTTFSVDENLPAGTHVALIIAGDNDVGNNSEVACHLSRKYQDFVLTHANSAKGREMYRLSTNISFDRETLNQGIALVGILCSDRGHPTQSTEKVLSVLVNDINEFSPEFLVGRRATTVTIEEGKSAGTFLYQTHAIDLDATPQIRYVLSRDAQAFFHIESDSGMITSRTPLDREETPQIRFIVFATDKDTLDLETSAAMTNITVEVTDINDNCPELIGERILKIVENRPGYSDLVGQLTSVDKDNGNNGTVRYKILSVLGVNGVPQNDTFMINSESGKVFTLKSLDREQNPQYLLHVLLYDLGEPEQRNTTEVITVTVLDENDNAPVWGPLATILPELEFVVTQDIYRHPPKLLGLTNVHEMGLLNITSPLIPGQRVAKLSAIDLDSSENANLSFRILSSYFTVDGSTELPNSGVKPAVSSFFNVMESTGEIVIGPGLHGTGLSKSGLMELYFCVSDNGNPSLDSVGRLFIHISLSTSGTFGANISGKDVLAQLFNSGQFGILLAVVLVFILCLTCICLAVALGSFRRNNSGSKKTCCLPSKLNTITTTSATSQLPLNSELSTSDGLLLDGNPCVLSKFYHTSKTKAPYTDCTSLCRWNAEPISYSLGNFGPPPVYNLSILNSTLDRMNSSHTGSDMSGSPVALLEIPGRNAQYSAMQQIMCNEQATFSPKRRESRYDCSGRDETSSREKIIVCNEVCHNLKSDSIAVKQPIKVGEIDGGSADSGQGASEDEPALIEGWKSSSQTTQQHNSFESPNSLCATSTTVGLALRKHRTPFKICLDHHQDNSIQTGISTFTQTVHPFGGTCDTKGCSTPSYVLPPPPLLSSVQAQWHDPFLASEEFGRRNEMFQENTVHFPNKVGRQSATLPAACKLAFVDNSQCRANAGSPKFSALRNPDAKSGFLKINH